MTAYRYWHVVDGHLHAPLAGDVLPEDGTLVAGCHRRHLPPHPACLCGVAAYRTADHARRALDTFGLDPEQFVITTGIAERPIIRDQRQQVYWIDGTPKIGPESVRARSYTVTAIFTDYPRSLAYHVPVHPMSNL